MKIWIDTDSGTWGEMGSLVAVEVDNAEIEMLENAPDSVIAEFGNTNGEALA